MRWVRSRELFDLSSAVRALTGMGRKPKTPSHPPRKQCDNCSGTGLVDHDDTPETDLQIPCPDCDGEGMVDA